MSREFGRILIIDLTDRTSRIWSLEAEPCRRFIGGAGLAAYVFQQLAPEPVAPLDPANPFIALTGPLTGTAALLSGRHSFAGRSPQTGFWGEASVGGHWGRELRRAGFDGLAILGRSEEPVYLYLNDGRLEIRNAGHLWGLDTFQTDQALKAELGDKVQTCVIGPAGENLVKFSGLFTDGVHARTAARCGLGALLGSKRVKGIAVRGTGEPPLREPEALKESAKALLADFTGRLKGMSEFGTPGLVGPCESIGDLPINNWRQGRWTEGAKRIGGQELKENYLKKKFFCAGCVVGCGRTVAGVLDPLLQETGGPEYETLGMLGSNCLIDSMPALLRLNELCNRLGLDTIDAGAVVAFAMELRERGLIGPAELGSLDLKWGDGRAAEALIGMIGRREGFGDVLAEGLGSAAAQVGGLAEECAVQAHNMALPAHDPRAYSSIALGYATSSRGPCHVNAFSHMFERATTFPEIGVEAVLDRFAAQGKAEMVVGAQHVMYLWDSLAMCKFNIFGGVRLHLVGQWIEQATGWDVDVAELLEAAERIFNLKRMLNIGWGWSRKDDRLPLRVLTLRTSDGGAGDHLPPFNVMLADYYKIRGWTEEGLPRPETLRRLDLDGGGGEHRS